MARRTQSPEVVHPFDLAYGTETGGLIPGPKLKTGHPHDRHNTAYHGTAPSLFRQIISRWQDSWTLAPPTEYAFVDIGSGKGRTLMLASLLPFRSVSGMELNPELAAVARENLRVFAPKAATPATILEGDVLAADLPAGPLLLYLFNPFGPTVIRRLMKKLQNRQSRPAEAGPLDVIYVNDEHRAVFEKQGTWQELWAGDLHLSAEDDAADRATIRRDANGLYAVEGYERCSLWRWQQPEA